VQFLMHGVSVHDVFIRNKMIEEKEERQKNAQVCLKPCKGQVVSKVVEVVGQQLE